MAEDEKKEAADKKEEKTTVNEKMPATDNTPEKEKSVEQDKENENAKSNSDEDDSKSKSEVKDEEGDKNEESGEKEKAKEEPVAKSRKGLFIIIGIVFLLLAGGGGYFLFTGESEEELTAKKEALKKEEEKPPTERAIYITMPEDIIGIVKDGSGKKHYVKIRLSIVTRDYSARNDLKKNIPLVSSALLELIETQKYHELKTLDGKKRLREKAFKVVTKVLTLNGDKVEKVIFINFIMD